MCIYMELREVAVKLVFDKMISRLTDFRIGSS